MEAERQREARERQQRPGVEAANVRGKMSAFEEKAAEQVRPPPSRPPKRVVRPPPAAAREPSPPREPTPPPREETPPPRELTPPPREPTPEPQPEDVDEWADEDQPTYDDVAGAQESGVCVCVEGHLLPLFKKLTNILMLMPKVIAKPISIF